MVFGGNPTHWILQSVESLVSAFVNTPLFRREESNREHLVESAAGQRGLRAIPPGIRCVHLRRPAVGVLRVSGPPCFPSGGLLRAEAARDQRQKFRKQRE